MVKVKPPQTREHLEHTVQLTPLTIPNTTPFETKMSNMPWRMRVFRVTWSSIWYRYWVFELYTPCIL